MTATQEVASVVERAAERMARAAARYILIEVQRRRMKPLTDRMHETLLEVRRLARKHERGRIPMRVAFDLLDKRSLSGLMLRGLVKWWSDGTAQSDTDIYLVQKEPDEDG